MGNSLVWMQSSHPHQRCQVTYPESHSQQVTELKCKVYPLICVPPPSLGLLPSNLPGLFMDSSPFLQTISPRSREPCTQRLLRAWHYPMIALQDETDWLGPRHIRPLCACPVCPGSGVEGCHQPLVSEQHGTIGFDPLVIS